MQHGSRNTRATADSLRHTERPHKCCGSVSGKHRAALGLGGHRAALGLGGHLSSPGC